MITTTPRPASPIISMARLQLAGLAIAAFAQHVGEHVQRMHAHQDRFVRPGDVALDQGDMLGIGDVVDVDAQLEVAAVAGC